MWWTLGLIVAVVAVWALHDIVQKKHSILHNFPVVGHFRYWLEHIGPELRQYIVTSDNEERPFSRAQRRWVYASSKSENNYFGFGTSVDLEEHPNHVIIKHSPFPLNDPHPGDANFDASYSIPSQKVLGEYRGRRHAFKPESLVNISGMSFGALSGPAIEAINRGCELAGALHNTGEGGVSPHHQHGGDLMWQIGTGYFGCREKDGTFSLERLMEVVEKNPVRALEIKLSQGAKPGVGGMLPAEKITPEIAAIRGIPMGKDCLSPSSHREFDSVDSMLDFVELLAQATGLPVGIKSAIGNMDFWSDLASQMATTNRGVDFITIDGGEGGTGAAPRVFSDHVALPFKHGMSRVYREFVAQDLQDHVTFIGSGKLGFPEQALLAFGMGCDMISVAREAMLSIGCIQAQRCHTGFCPAGVATQNKWLMAGLDPTLKAARLANYLVSLRKELLRLCRACGVSHPAYMTLDHFELLGKGMATQPAADAFGYDKTVTQAATLYEGIVR
ncbi:FMN-binding glutamate synthase family protein [Adhaeretor mobilis]|uniref:Glutamate synthase [NADPH] large chain n=1 Tax=Adhaeretor mobilis TaxID=1930276 RepID=A0A517N125_9BACT|nr:FMN-binding glutamate synthase family protein [Adhaeretor mobilis]QDT00840.1 Glutamate synthase [NADPH] large chain [Adhaeretor mobilis]